MRYGRDYGHRGGFVSRAMDTVRGWVGADEHHGYDRGYREMGGMDRGYDPRHGGWDVDWEDRGMRGGGMQGRGMPGGGYGHYARRDFMTNRGYYDPQGGMRESRGPRMGGGMHRGAYREMGGMDYDRGFRGGWAGDADRTVEYGGRGREWHLEMRRGGGMPGDYARDMNRGGTRPGGWNAGGPWAAELQDDDAGGTIGAYGAYGNYGVPRFRSNNMGGMNPGQYYNGYGIGSGYRYGG